MSDTGLPETLYDGAAAIGRTESYIGVILGSIFAVIFIVIGVAVLLKKSKDPKTNTKVLGGMVIGIGVLTGVFTGLSFYMAQHYKAVAAINGAGNVFNITRAVFHK
jgi:Ca2+/Na+ antiporter